MPNDCYNYEHGYSPSYRHWIGKYSNCSFNYFARHKEGRPIDYQFNSIGYRGNEHYSNPEISVFGSSFSFGVGISFEECWHQQLGDYRVNCYSPAGFLVTNNDIIDHYNSSNITSGIVILQLREFQYNTDSINIPDNVNCFVIDVTQHDNLLSFSYDSFVDKAEDQTHPGSLTHKQWAHEIKIKFNL